MARATKFLAPTVDSGFRKEKQVDQLFQKTDPQVDGEDCLHDCASCTETLPRKWAIEEEHQLYGRVGPWDTHLIVGTGRSDWQKTPEEEKGSMMQTFDKLRHYAGTGDMFLSASNLPSWDGNDEDDKIHEPTNGKKRNGHASEEKIRCVVMPRWEVIDGIGHNEAKWLLEDIVGKSSTTSTPLRKTLSKPQTVTLQHNMDQSETHEPTVQVESELKNGLARPKNGVHPPTMTSDRPSFIPRGVTIRPLPHSAMILMCSHGTRDWRCGKSAPILKREFERHLRPLGLFRDMDDMRPGGVGVYFIDHVGGHKYSANVIIYRRQGSTEYFNIVGKGLSSAKQENQRQVVDSEIMGSEAVQGIWLARVRPEDCENIVRYTVLQGKVVKPERQLRGGFDRERGVLSW